VGQASLQLGKSAADFVLESGLALMVHDRSAARKDAAAIGPSSGCGGGCVVMTTGQRHFG
jgi:hypothetical protein